MEAARPSASASRETQELLRLFQEAKKAGAVVQVGPKIDRSSEECFDLLPRALDSEWKLHGVWLAAPAEDLDMREFDALLAGRHRESPAFTSARWPDAPAASRFRS
jgi:hypothetical protein